MENDNIKIKTYLTMTVRNKDGSIREVIKPYETASLGDKILFYLGLKNLTRSV